MVKKEKTKYMILEKGKNAKFWRSMYPKKTIYRTEAIRAVRGLRKTFGNEGRLYKMVSRKRKKR